MKQVVFHPEAAEEVRQAADYYDTRQSGLGEEFRLELRAALFRIRQNPLIYAVESGSIRLCMLHRFPYTVYYEELPEQIWVAAVGHHSRRPGYWLHRRPG